MIVKNLTRKSGSGQLINYIFKYILKDEKQPEKSPYVFRHNVRSTDLKGYIKEFKENAKHRIHTRKDQVAIHHTILSWSNKDRERLTEEKIHRMARHYISLRGLHNLYIGAIHTDREHIHLHIAMSATELNGRASRLSKAEFADLKLSLDEYQREQYPELCNSLPDHGKWARVAPEVGVIEHPVQAEAKKCKSTRDTDINTMELELAALQAIRNPVDRSLYDDFDIER